MIDSNSEISRELDSDEKLLWSGCPRDGIILRSSDVLMIPLSIFWLGFTIFWMAGATGSLWISDGEKEAAAFSFIFPLFGLPFVAVGLYMAIGRFWVDKAMREKTVYGVTNERVIIRSGLFSRTVKSLNIHTLSDISLKEKDDGSGTISLGPSNPMNGMLEGMNWWPGMGQYSSPSIDSIPDARSVYNIIREQQK